MKLPLDFLVKYVKGLVDLGNSFCLHQMETLLLTRVLCLSDHGLEMPNLNICLKNSELGRYINIALGGEQG